MEKTPLNERITQMLTEARVVLPGVQALLGFQLTSVISQSFEKLPASSKLVHERKIRRLPARPRNRKCFRQR